MSNFLTVEDVNSCFMNAFDTCSMYECSTADINDDEDYIDIDYDFIKVSHSKSGNNHTFSFKIKNSAWNGDYYFLDANGDYINSNASYSNNILSITTTSSNVTLCLYLSYLKVMVSDFQITRLIVVPLDFQPMIVGDANYYKFKSLRGETDITFSSNATVMAEYIGDGIYNIYCLSSLSMQSDGYVELNVKGGTNYFYYIPQKEKPKLEWVRYTVDVIPGIMNTLKFRSAGYNQGVINPHFYYKGEELPVNKIGAYYYVDLDLTEKKDIGDILINMKFEETEYYCNDSIDYIFKCRNARVTSSDALEAELLNGTPLIELANDITLTNNIFINHTVYLEGKDKTINLNGHSIVLNEESSLNIKNLSLYNGDKAIIQSKNSKLLLENCTFENNITDNIGSCIYCKVDMDNINENDDFITSIKNCNFINNNSCISHNGRLIITDSEYWNNDLDYADKKFPAFLYQNNGEVSIRNSIFDIEYTGDDFCSDEQSIGFAQSLIHCGESAFINGANMQQLKEDNRLPFFEAPYSNRSHVFAKYYYPRIEACAYTSPELGFEDKSVCYSVSEDNWVYKQNAKVTRVGDENTLRRITHV